MKVGIPVNFGRFRGPNGPAGGACAPVGGREIGGDVAGGVAADGWRLWCWTHWRQPAVSPTRKGGESASSAPPGKGGKVPVQPHPERGGKCHLWRWRRSAGDFEVVLSGGSSALRSWTDRGRRSWRPPGSIRPSGGCSDGRQGWIKYIMQSFLEGRIHSRRERRRDLGERRLILSPATVGSRRDPLPAESPSYRTGDPSAAV